MLTFTYPGFACGSHGSVSNGSPVPNQAKNSTQERRTHGAQAAPHPQSALQPAGCAECDLPGTLQIRAQNHWRLVLSKWCDPLWSHLSWQWNHLPNTAAHMPDAWIVSCPPWPQFIQRGQHAMNTLCMRHGCGKAWLSKLVPFPMKRP